MFTYVSSAKLTEIFTVPSTVNAYTVLLSLPGVNVSGKEVTFIGVTLAGTYEICDSDLV